MINQDIGELKTKLEELRASNRKLSMQNIVLKTEINDINEEIKKFNDQKVASQSNNENRKRKTNIDMEKDGIQQAKLRQERRRIIMADIRKYTEENKAINDSIKEMTEALAQTKSEVSRMKAAEKARNKVLKNSNSKENIPQQEQNQTNQSNDGESKKDENKGTEQPKNDQNTEKPSTSTTTKKKFNIKTSHLVATATQRKYPVKTKD